MKLRKNLITSSLAVTVALGTFSFAETTQAQENNSIVTSPKTVTTEFQGQKVEFKTDEKINSKTVTVLQGNKKTVVTYDKVKDTLSIDGKVVLSKASQNINTLSTPSASTSGTFQTMKIPEGSGSGGSGSWKFIHTKYGQTKTTTDNIAILAAAIAAVTPFPANALMAASSVILTTKVKNTYWTMREWGRMSGLTYQRKATIEFYRDSKRKKFITSEEMYFYDKGGPK
ncbi:hypothetical protein P9D34_13475 [Bacillus swezeyi]|uniref:Uncharacterized protein n=1 Tax=Bacillus swezeyi TaxID=1925020 RepID=A0A1R1RP75_9BACI|nr:hypothetical protein [Bacillus swezeyi]MEC1261443.1 hypothetical protein [Bacillus swezeyi]MED2926694.1 hypothetical protein [Bacillus swezeyi]MED2944167.1 hypothetical protein [Bacillus swezeyi]MED2965744.1 hypothetical protein [Bacillus swezeyi]MED3070853.1 hypothetical protein [Bacillus swezeyi]